MKPIKLETKRPWNWKVFPVLVGPVIPAAHHFAKSDCERDCRSIELHQYHARGSDGFAGR